MSVKDCRNSECAGCFTLPACNYPESFRLWMKNLHTIPGLRSLVDNTLTDTALVFPDNMWYKNTDFLCVVHIVAFPPKQWWSTFSFSIRDYIGKTIQFSAHNNYIYSLLINKVYYSKNDTSMKNGHLKYRGKIFYNKLTTCFYIYCVLGMGITE